MGTQTDTDRVAALIGRLARAADAACFAEGLNPAQWDALRYFATANRFSRTASAFASYHGTSRGTASQTVRALVRKGLLERQENGRDGRSFDLLVSRAGDALLSRDPAGVLTRAVAGLAPIARTQLADALEVLRDTLGDSLGSFGRCKSCVCLRRDGESGAFFCTAAGEALQSDELDLVCVNHAGARCA